MLSKEEKEMLDIFREEVEKEQKEYNQVNEYTKFFYNNHKFILNLLEKSQKQLRESKSKEEYFAWLCKDKNDEIKSKDKEIIRLQNILLDKIEGTKIIKEETTEYIKENYISKDIIKNKIKEKQDKINKLHSASDCVIIDDLENEINVLKELLGDE